MLVSDYGDEQYTVPRQDMYKGDLRTVRPLLPTSGWQLRSYRQRA